jgi:hypothetical protein
VGRAELVLYLVGVATSGALFYEVPRQLRAWTTAGAINVIILLALLVLSVGGLIKLRFDRDGDR